jgi:hypothetical protein
MAKKKYKTIKVFVAIDKDGPYWISPHAFDDCDIPATIKILNIAIPKKDIQRRKTK